MQSTEREREREGSRDIEKRHLGRWEQRVRKNMKNNFIKLSPLVRYSLIIETLKIVQQNFPCILSFLFVLSPSAASLTPSVLHRGLHTYCTYVTCSVISVTFYVKLNKKKKF